jgi:beta-lactamase class D
MSPHFASDEDGCLAYVELGHTEIVSQGKNCKLQTAPCSTFKIAIAEIGYKYKKLNEIGENFKWDGLQRSRDVLNRDQDLFSWMKDSVVWVSSILVSRMSRETIQSELKEMSYGNSAIGPDEFWINGPLRISAEEQVKSLSRQTNSNLQKAVLLLPIEKRGAFSISGKTGSCAHRGTKPDEQIGWYVGRARSGNKVYAFALRFLKPKNAKQESPAGLRAKELFLDWLSRPGHGFAQTQRSD